MLVRDKIVDLDQKNVAQSSNDFEDIYKKINTQYGKKFKPSILYGSGNSGKNIVKILKQQKKFSTQKIITY